MNELQELLKDYRESDGRILFFCDCSFKFKTLWASLENRIKIAEKAKLFLQESRPKFQCITVSCFVGIDSTLFTTSNRVFVRIESLEWAIAKGYKTINDLFE